MLPLHKLSATPCARSKASTSPPSAGPQRLSRRRCRPRRWGGGEPPAGIPPACVPNSASTSTAINVASGSSSPDSVRCSASASAAGKALAEQCMTDASAYRHSPIRGSTSRSSAPHRAGRQADRLSSSCWHAQRQENQGLSREFAGMRQRRCPPHRRGMLQVLRILRHTIALQRDSPLAMARLRRSF